MNEEDLTDNMINYRDIHFSSFSNDRNEL